MATRLRIGLMAVLVIAIAGAVAFMVTRPGDTPATGNKSDGPRQTYVALGDSVAAGTGLTTDSDSSACNRTDESYPRQAATELSYDLANLSCSSATLTAGITGPQEVNKLVVAPQIKQLFDQPQPDVISLTVGANDTGWTEFIAACYTAGCGTAADSAAVSQRLGNVASGLRAAFTQIQTRYGSKTPRLIVSGYHQVFPAAPANPANCPDIAGVDAAEQQWVRQQMSILNSTIRDAVSGFPFAVFVPVDFSGHELCSADSWVQGINDKQPYHPAEGGQTAYAKQIADAARKPR